MAGRKKKSTKPVAQVFNVVYEDGSLSSNRRIPGELLIDPFGTEDVMDLAQRAIEHGPRRDRVAVVRKGGLRGEQHLAGVGPGERQRA